MADQSKEVWAIIEDTTTYILGDERSRTNPGHGYPADYVTSTTYTEYKDYDKFEDAVLMKTARGDHFRAVKVTPLKITTKIEIG